MSAHTLPTPDEFLNGKPLHYARQSGLFLVAVFQRAPLCHIRITTRDGRRLNDQYVTEDEARHFLANRSPAR